MPKDEDNSNYFCFHFFLLFVSFIFFSFLPLAAVAVELDSAPRFRRVRCADGTADFATARNTEQEPPGNTTAGERHGTVRFPHGTLPAIQTNNPFPNSPCLCLLLIFCVLLAGIAMTEKCIPFLQNKMKNSEKKRKIFIQKSCDQKCFVEMQILQI